MKQKIFSKYRIYKVILIFIGITFSISCENEIEKVEFFSNENKVADQTANDIKILYTEEGMIQIRITAPLLEHYKDKENPILIFPNGLNVDFYNSEKKIESNLKANFAKYFEKQQLWEAKHDVQAVNVDNDTLNTELLYWDEKKGIIYSDEFVRIKRSDEIWYGDGFEANQNFTKYHIKKLKGIVAIKDE